MERQLALSCVCAWYMCICAWYMCICAWYMCICAWYMCICAWYMCICAWYMCICAWYMCICAWYMCICAWYMCVCAWYMCICASGWNAPALPPSSTSHGSRAALRYTTGLWPLSHSVSIPRRWAVHRVRWTCMQKVVCSDCHCTINCAFGIWIVGRSAYWLAYASDVGAAVLKVWHVQ